MFGIKKLKRRINDLDISRNEWMKIAKTALEEIKSLKNDIESIKDGMNKWMKIANDRLEEIKTLKDENASLKEKIETLKTEEYSIEYCREIVNGGDDWKDIAIRCIFLNKNLKEEKDNTIKTLQSEVERLTRKRDANGRFVKSAETAKHIFKVDDRVKIAKGFEPEKHRESSNKYKLPFVKDMDEDIGKIGRVIQLHENGILTVDFGDVPFPYDYHPDWLEHAE